MTHKRFHLTEKRRGRGVMSLLGVPFAVTNWKGRVRPSGCGNCYLCSGADSLQFTQSLCLIGLESADEYRLTVNDIPKRGKILMTLPIS
ncbi:hypothetical protein TNCV_519921 [Trichonephila clavipes]|nr:hypothetical protein TNCV_519921 [Trichonephila clavipes]